MCIRDRCLSLSFLQLPIHNRQLVVPEEAGAYRMEALGVHETPVAAVRHHAQHGVTVKVLELVAAHRVEKRRHVYLVGPAAARIVTVGLHELEPLGKHRHGILKQLLVLLQLTEIHTLTYLYFCLLYTSDAADERSS